MVKESYCVSTLNHRLMDGVLKSCSRNLYEVVVVFLTWKMHFRVPMYARFLKENFINILLNYIKGVNQFYPPQNRI